MGRHSVPDDYEDGAAAVLSTPVSSANRPLPGRHTGGERPDPGTSTPEAVDDVDDAPQGLDMIEIVMSGDEDTGNIPVVRADADPREFEDHTAQIEPIVDPVLDEPLPDAVTTLIPPVPDDGPTDPAAPADVAARPLPQSGRTPRPGQGEPSAAEPDDEPAEAPAKPDKAAAKAEAKRVKAQAKAEAKAAKTAKTAKTEVKPATTPTTKPATRPEPRASDLTLLRTDSAARARVIAAIVVPFLLYVGVLFVLDAFDLRTVLIWIWVPLISAGVVAGLLLDLAHRAAAARAVAALEPAPESSDAGR